MVDKLAQDLVDLIYRFIPQPSPSQEALKNAKIIAHRGLGGSDSPYPENTLSAFKTALAAGAWGIEFDVRFSKDHRPFIHHDPTPLTALTEPEIRKRFPDIVFLRDLIQEFQNQSHFMIELKEPLTESNRMTFHEALQGLEPSHDFHLLSLNPAILKQASMYYPKTCLLAVCERNVQTMLKTTLSEGWAGLLGHYVLLSDRVQLQLKHRNMKVGTGYICSKNSLRRELNRQVDWIFTNHTQLLTRWLTDLKKPQV